MLIVRFGSFIKIAWGTILIIDYFCRELIITQNIQYWYWYVTQREISKTHIWSYNIFIFCNQNKFPAEQLPLLGVLALIPDGYIRTAAPDESNLLRTFRAKKNSSIDVRQDMTFQIKKIGRINIKQNQHTSNCYHCSFFLWHVSLRKISTFWIAYCVLVKNICFKSKL